ncbi:MAG: hypothetical protein ABSG78_11925 [Verrucomicrobiota bacterium]|jgi:hypothetical protein
MRALACADRRPRRSVFVSTVLIVLLAAFPLLAQPAALFTGSSNRIFASDGQPADAKFFPIAVWCQNPVNAKRFQAAGINLYLALWEGPTAAQLNELQSAHMPVICSQTPLALENKDNPIIAGWMHEDEPDNAQSLGAGKGYGPPIPPERIVTDYQRIRSIDPSRPVMLNLGQGVAWDDWVGRGVRTRHPEDYPKYIEGCDIASFDIYPAVHDSPQVAGKLEFVARGVERLATWTRGQKPVWCAIECTHINNPNVKPTPQQVRAEVWMALVGGARGLIYFVHQFKPSFREAALLDDPLMLAAVTEINRQIRDLAPVLNSPALPGGLTVQSSNSGARAAVMLKHYDGAAYVFAVNLANQPTRATFTLRDPDPARQAQALGESRLIPVQGQTFADDFAPYAVHLYKLSP